MFWGLEILQFSVKFGISLALVFDPCSGGLKKALHTCLNTFIKNTSLFTEIWLQIGNCQAHDDQHMLLNIRQRDTHVMCTCQIQLFNENYDSNVTKMSSYGFDLWLYTLGAQEQKC